jgi:hypothetical protein
MATGELANYGRYSAHAETIEQWRAAHESKDYREARRLARTFDCWFDTADQSMFKWATIMARRIGSEKHWSAQRIDEKVSDIVFHFVRYLHGSKGHLAAVADGIPPAGFWDHPEFRSDAWNQARFGARYVRGNSVETVPFFDDLDGEEARHGGITAEQAPDLITPEVGLNLLDGEAAGEAARAIAWATSESSTLSPDDRKIVAFEVRYRREQRTDDGLNEALARYLYPADCGSGAISGQVQARTRTRINTARERLQGALIGRAREPITAWLNRDARRRPPVFSMVEQVVLRFLIEIAPVKARATVHTHTRAPLPWCLVRPRQTPGARAGRRPRLSPRNSQLRAMDRQPDHTRLARDDRRTGLRVLCPMTRRALGADPEGS